MKEEQASVLALYKADLENQQEAYEQKNRELENQMTAIAILRADLEERTELLDDQQTVIEDQEGILGNQQSRIEKQQKQLEEQQAKLKEQQALLTEQHGRLKEQQKQLDSQADQIEQIIGVRGQLIDALNRELEANQIQIRADKATGAIAFESEILFARDSNELSEKGKEFFQNFMPIYLEVLFLPEFREYIAEVIVEGHTDDTGQYLHNLELSQQRAWSVAEYFLNEDCEFLSQEIITGLKALITVNGCADKDPVYREDGTIDSDKSRRVEIKFRLRDQEMIQEMDEILN